MKSASRRKGSTYKSQKHPKIDFGKWQDRDQFGRKTRGMSQFLEQTQYQRGNSNIIHQNSRNHEIQSIVHQ